MRLKKSLKYIVLLVLTVSLGLLFGFTENRNLSKKISEIHVDFSENEARFLSISMVNKLLIQNQETVKNQPKSKLDLYRLEQKVLTNPYVESTSVYTTINGELFATVKERTPIARVLIDNASYYLDKKGVKIPLSQNYSARVPLIMGISTTDNLDEIYDFMHFIFEDEFLRKEITGVRKMLSGEFQLMVRSGDYRIEFGKLKNIEKKFKKLKAFYSKTLLDKTIFNYKTINLKFHNQVVGVK